MGEYSKNKDSSKAKFWPMILVAVAIVLIVFLGLWQLNFMWHKKPSTANEFGDSFGMANALFSALAFAFLIVTAIMQKKELELQREELGETKAELRKSAIAQNATQEALNIQVRIMAKQAMLSSYESLYQANLPVSQSVSVQGHIKKKAELECKKYLILIEKIVLEMEDLSLIV